MNVDSKALCHEWMTNKIIPEIKKDHDNDLTKELKLNNTKSKVKITLSESINTTSKNLF
ncbi:hypothetical protein HNO90_000256 [Staphylococcus hominis]|nr:hypothetical protein [Staphylococcus hominis]